jgi:hypothetical protein
MARDLGDTGVDGDRQFEFVVSYSMIGRLGPVSRITGGDQQG